MSLPFFSLIISFPFFFCSFFSDFSLFLLLFLFHLFVFSSRLPISLILLISISVSFSSFRVFLLISPRLSWPMEETHLLVLLSHSPFRLTLLFSPPSSLTLFLSLILCFAFLLLFYYLVSPYLSFVFLSSLCCFYCLFISSCFLVSCSSLSCLLFLAVSFPLKSSCCLLLSPCLSSRPSYLAVIWDRLSLSML